MIMQAELPNLLTDLAQFVQTVKGEWGNQGAWSEWDQSVQDRLLAALEAALSASPSAQTEVDRVTGQPVALVIVTDEANGDEYAIFANQQAATAWADQRPEPCVIVYPMIIGEPEFGNVQHQ